MNKIAMKPGTLLAPLPPVLVSCGDMEQSNIITIGWTGILNTQPAKTYISVRPERHSYNIIKESGEFIINLPCESLVRAVDWCGCRTGSKYDKFAQLKLTKKLATKVACPQIDECPITIECRVTEIVPLGTHDMFVADILAVNIDEKLFDDKGKIRIEKAHLMAYAHGEYFALGRRLGSFGCSVKKKRKAPPKNKKGK
ncbi:MAG: flavin reductase family protein [Oscillospiraceae bacterium]|nr:flavin reductase family protein [Oscillospiraceae bacterium]